MDRVSPLDLVFSHDADARPVAAARGTAAAPNDLAAFLTEEVHWPFYASLFLDQAMAAPGSPPITATGNAYAMTCDDDTVTIEHLHIPGRRPIRLLRQDFVATMAAWRAHLESGA